MDDLIAFCRARLDEEEQMARDKRVAGEERDLWIQTFDGNTASWEEIVVGSNRLLAEVQAKRAIVDRAESWQAGTILDHTQLEPWWEHDAVGPPLRWVVQQMATVWADHPQYQDRWRP